MIHAILLSIFLSGLCFGSEMQRFQDNLGHNFSVNQDNEDFVHYYYQLDPREVKGYVEFGNAYNIDYKDAKKNELYKKLLPFYGKDIASLSTKELNEAEQEISNKYKQVSPQKLYSYLTGVTLGLLEYDEKSFAEERIDLKHNKDLIEKFKQHHKLLEQHKNINDKNTTRSGLVALGSSMGLLFTLCIVLDRWFNNQPLEYPLATAAFLAGIAGIGGIKLVDGVNRHDSIFKAKERVEFLLENSNTFQQGLKMKKGPVFGWKQLIRKQDL